MNVSAKHTLNKLPVGTKIKFTNIARIEQSNYHVDKGVVVVLTKEKDNRSKPYWVDKFIKWPMKAIPSTFEILKPTI